MNRPKRTYVGSNLKIGSTLMGLLGASLGGPIGWSVAVGCVLIHRKASQVEKSESQSFKEASHVYWLSGQRWPSYQDYLCSDTWNVKREAVLQRAGFRCEHPGCVSTAQEVHHLYYPKKWGYEPTSDLQALCIFHHRETHGHPNRDATESTASGLSKGVTKKMRSAEVPTVFVPSTARQGSMMSPVEGKSRISTETLKSQRHVVACSCRGEVEGCIRCYGSGEYIKDGLGQIV